MKNKIGKNKKHKENKMKIETSFYMIMHREDISKFMIQTIDYFFSPYTYLWYSKKEAEQWKAKTKISDEYKIVKVSLTI